MSAPDLDISILKVLLSNKKFATEFVYEFSEKLFVPEIWRFAKVVIDYIKTYKEVPTKRVLSEKIRASKNDVFANNAEQLFDRIEKFVYDEREYKHDLEKFKNRYATKLIYDLKTNIANQEGNIDLKKSVTEIQSTLSNIKGINQVKAYEQKSLKESVEDFKNRYTAKMDDPTFGVGLLTGYSFLDYTLCGLRPGELMIIGAPTGGFKSTLMMNIAINMWLNGNTVDMEKNFREGADVLYFSLEMGFNDCEERVLSRLAMVPQKGIRDAKLESKDTKKLSTAIKFIKNYPYNFEIVDIPRGATIEAIELIYNDIVARKKKPKVVIIDYLNLMEFKGGSADEQDWLKQMRLSEVVHEFGRVSNTILISAVQLSDPSGGGKNSQETMTLKQISRSKGIAFNADFVLFIEKRNEENNYPELNLHLLKSRRSELVKGKAYKNLACTALLDKPVSELQEIDDISDKIEDIFKMR